MREVMAARVPRQGSMWVMRLMAFSVLFVAAGIAFSAHAQGHHRGHGSDRPMMMEFGGSPEHAGRAVDRLLEGLNATDAQRSQIKQIATAAATDLKAQRDASGDLHEEGMQLLTAPTVDAAAAEAVRQQMSAQQEQASKRMLKAMIEVANVLTPEQRAKLGERMKQHHAAMEDRRQHMSQEKPRERAPRGAPAASQPGAPK